MCLEEREWSGGTLWESCMEMEAEVEEEVIESIAEAIMVCEEETIWENEEEEEEWMNNEIVKLENGSNQVDKPSWLLMIWVCVGFKIGRWDQRQKKRSEKYQVGKEIYEIYVWVRISKACDA